MQRTGIVVAIMLLLASSALAEDGDVPRRRSGSQYVGLSVVAGAGAIICSDNTANFYSGRDNYPNTISRVLYSDVYGNEIWNNLVNKNLISPTTIGSYNEFQVVEYPKMSYRTTYAFNVGIRNDYSSGFGWVLMFDYAKVEAIGAFNLSSNNGSGVVSDRGQYVRCGMLGIEQRINIDLAIARSVYLTKNTILELNLGVQMNNTKVQEQTMEIAAKNYSILDVWGGKTPNYDVGDYEYMNQGGIGYGVFMGLHIGYNVPHVGAIKVGYTAYQSKIVLEKSTSYGWQHLIGVRFEMNNFSFI